MEITVKNLEEFENEAARFAGALGRSEYGASLVALSGELGAGKTAFTKAVARALGVDEVVSSPTFVLEKLYTLPDGETFKRLIHIDAYRLEKGSDLDALQLYELMRDDSNLILLEWPERVAHSLPPVVGKISFTVLPDGARKISYG